MELPELMNVLASYLEEDFSNFLSFCEERGQDLVEGLDADEALGQLVAFKDKLDSGEIKLVRK